MSKAMISAEDRRAESLLAAYEQAGYERVRLAILQPAEPFLALSGEDIRRRMYRVNDAAGREVCLRPDLTIPVALDYLASGASGRRASLSYLGPVFRQRVEGADEFLQAGIESFGRGDKAAADAEMLSLALAATTHYGLAEPEIRMGDVGLFVALIGALGLPPAWTRRLVKDFNRKALLVHDLDRLALAGTNGRPEYQGVLAALANSDPKAARALVADLLSIAGISTVGGRSVDEIADRFLEQAELGASAALPAEMRTVIERFLTVAGDPDSAAAALWKLAQDADIDLSPALDLFESRTGLFAAQGIDTRRIRFATAFGRGLDYYAGFVFELYDPRGRVEGQLVAGGRYDGLFPRLGCAEPVPAVGLAAWIERLERLGGAQ